MSSPLLKIGIICYPSVGGSGILATELGHQLAKRGHEIHFISYEIPFRLNTELENIFFHKVHINEYELFRYPDYTLPLAVKIAEISSSYNLDILHTHYAVPHAIAAELAKHMTYNNAPKVIATLHGTDITLMGQDKSYQPIIQYAIQNACGVTTVSEHLKQQTINTFDIQKDIHVIHNFYSPKHPSISKEKMKQKLGIKEDEYVVLHMSNLRPVKRISDILEIIAYSQYTDKLKLLILSGGNFNPYMSEVKTLNIEKNIILQENVGDIENYIQIADTGIYPSGEESFGLSILETMFHGVPVIASRAGGIPEVVDDTITGLLHPVGAIEEFSRSLDYLIEHDEERRTMGEKAKKSAEKLFSTDIIVEQYIAFYYMVIKTCPSHNSNI